MHFLSLFRSIQLLQAISFLPLSSPHLRRAKASSPNRSELSPSNDANLNPANPASTCEDLQASNECKESSESSAPNYKVSVPASGACGAQAGEASASQLNSPGDFSVLSDITQEMAPYLRSGLYSHGIRSHMQLFYFSAL